MHSQYLLYTFPQVQLSVEDIETILDTLIYDGKVEKTVSASDAGEEVQLYRAVRPLIGTTGLMKTPCGMCPVSIGYL